MRILNTKKKTTITSETTSGSIVYVDPKWSGLNISDMYAEYCKKFSHKDIAKDDIGPLTLTINGQKTYPTLCGEDGYIWHYSLRRKNENS